MVYHILLFKFTRTTTQTDIQRIMDKFEGCKNVIEGFKEIEYGQNVSSKLELSHGFTYAVLMIFTDKEAIKIYNQSPLHKEARELQKPFVEDVLVFDILV